VAKRIVPAARQDDCQRNHHENMRPISFHMVTGGWGAVSLRLMAVSSPIDVAS
jgi:hypothetical protein